ncbi:MAG: DUF1573 domain-containing protein [Bacteroidales bacterium]|jgi:hypothetical protein|nr:DUF1573 domain-containing protein [Bacteroidales bacterium]
MMIKNCWIQSILFFCAALCVVSCGGSKKKLAGITVHEIHNPATANRESSKNERMPVLTFETTTHDFGRVVRGEKLSYSFKFTNTGNANLIIESTETSCNCTASTPPKAPIRPGESGVINVSFDSKTKSGLITNAVLVSANTYPVITMLKINANVVNP